nr:ACT domain-containing protein [Candidatus Microthrix sp.]
MADTPTPAYSLRIRVRMENRPGMLGRLAMAIGEVGANIAALDGFEVKTSHLVQNAVVYCSGEAHQKEVLEAVNAIDGIVVLEWSDQVFDLHEGGKIELRSLSELRHRRPVDGLHLAWPGLYGDFEEPDAPSTT